MEPFGDSGLNVTGTVEVCFDGALSDTSGTLTMFVEGLESCKALFNHLGIRFYDFETSFFVWIWKP